MSTIAYAQLTNAREAAAPGKSTSEENPGLRTYVDAFAALVPAEVLTLHAVIISFLTKSQQTPPGAGAVTLIPPDAMETLKVTFWGLVVLSMCLFAVPRYLGGKWDKYDFVRLLIVPFAFAGWTALQRTTAFDAAFPQIHDIPRTVGALFLGAILGAVTAWLALVADKKP